VIGAQAAFGGTWALANGDRTRWDWIVAGLRRRLRGNELWFLALALAIGVCSGALAWILGLAAHSAQRWVFDLPTDGRLSEVERLAPARLLMLPLGGAVVGIASYFLGRWSSRPVDVIEANALHGGRIPMRDSLVVTGETLLSNGAGASVGLEAAYAQIGGGAASVIGQWVRLRRNDLRTLVGAGAGAAIGAAFGAPLTGTFYAFEIVMGAYTPASIAPVAAASLAAVATAGMLGETPYIIVAPEQSAFEDPHALLYIGLGIICAAAGIGVIRLVTLMESVVRRSGIPERMRPFVGGLLLMPLAFATPQVLSAGHGALSMDISGKASGATSGAGLWGKCRGPLCSSSAMRFSRRSRAPSSRELVCSNWSGVSFGPRVLTEGISPSPRVPGSARTISPSRRTARQ